jgi:hypothetical protein
MLYVPFGMAVGVTGTLDLKVFLLLMGVTFVFLSQRPLERIINGRRSSAAFNALPVHFYWLSSYWLSSTVLFAILYYRYRLQGLTWFAFLGIPVVMAFTYILARNRVRTVLGELVGILGLTMTAPLAHYVATGEIQSTGFFLWGLNVLYFASSVFYVKAKVQGALKVRTKAAGGATSINLFCSIYHWALLTFVTGVVLFTKIPSMFFLAFLPIIVRGIWGTRRAEAKLSFSRIGWLEVAYSLFFALISIWALRVRGFV